MENYFFSKKFFAVKCSFFQLFTNIFEVVVKVNELRKKCPGYQLRS